MASPSDNPFHSPHVEQPKDSIDHGTTGNWQITAAVVLTYLLSGGFLVLAVLLLIIGMSSMGSDMVYLTDVFKNELVFMGPAAVKRLVYGLLAAAIGSVVLSGVSFAAAMGLQKRRQWGHHLAMGLAVLALLPLGLLATDFAYLAIPWGLYGVVVLLVLLPQKNRPQFQHGRADAQSLKD